MTGRRESVRDALIALSLANLHFLAAWSALLAVRNLIWRTSILVDIAAVALCVVGLAAVLFVAIRIARPLRPRVNGVQHVFLLALVVPVDWARTKVPLTTRGFWSQRLGAGGDVAWAALMLVVGLCAVAIYVRNPDRVRHALQQAVLVFLPLLPICLVQALYYERTLALPPTGPALPHHVGRPRVIWLLFDEMDFSIAFTHRPGFALPNLDRLRNESLFATAATSPSTQTPLSVTSLLAGRHVSAFVPISARDAVLRYSDSTRHAGHPSADGGIRWSSTETLFDRVRALGLNAAVAGPGSLPYCRVFSPRLTRCENTAPSVTVARAALLTLLRHPALAHDPLGVSRTLETRAATLLRPVILANHLKVLDVTRRFANDASLAFVFAHFLLPHEPFVAGTPPSYSGNLMLTDSLFGAIRRGMEGSGTWNGTTVIVASDHGLRFRSFLTPGLTHLEDELFGTDRTRQPKAVARHVPFFIKFGATADPLTYDRPFNTVLLAELTLKLLRREFSTAKDVAAWIDAQRQAAPPD